MSTTGTHTAIIYTIQGGAEGYLVTCPQGCNLGTTARQATREGAQRMVELHKLATS
jgi:hypothetical protein